MLLKKTINVIWFLLVVFTLSVVTMERSFTKAEVIRLEEHRIARKQSVEHYLNQLQQAARIAPYSEEGETYYRLLVWTSGMPNDWTRLNVQDSEKYSKRLGRWPPSFETLKIHGWPDPGEEVPKIDRSLEKTIVAGAVFTSLSTVSMIWLVISLFWPTIRLVGLRMYSRTGSALSCTIDLVMHMKPDTKIRRWLAFLAPFFWLYYFLNEEDSALLILIAVIVTVLGFTKIFNWINQPDK